MRLAFVICICDHSAPSSQNVQNVCSLHSLIYLRERVHSHAQSDTRMHSQASLQACTVVCMRERDPMHAHMYVCMYVCIYV